MSEPAKILTVGGSDSGGAAGIQADLKTFTALGVYGMSVVTAVTAQNSVEVAAVHSLPAPFVLKQLQVVLADYGAAAIKIGFTGSAALVEALAAALAPLRAGPDPPFLVVDPVLVNHRRQPLFPPAVARAYLTHLLPLADLVTPNWAEAGLLLQRPLSTRVQVVSAARELAQTVNVPVLLTGWVDSTRIVDFFADHASFQQWSQPRLDTPHTHGSGDTLSAAIAALLGQGVPLLAAIAEARRLTALAIDAARSWQLGQGHGPLNQLVLRP